MQVLRRILCLTLAISLVSGLAGCAKPGSNTNGDYETRPEYKQEGTKVYEDNDHIFDYKTADLEITNDYTIVVPTGNANAKESATLLQKYFKEALNLNLALKADNVAETDKEILVGATARSESKKELKENQLSVFTKGKKLVFAAGHNVTLDSAVKKYIRLAPEKGKAATFDLTTDFVSEKDGYKYVWGDEFEGIGLDPNNWELIQKMAGNEVVEVSTDKAVVDVNDGRLKMHAISYFNKLKPSVEYRVPCSPVTQNKMNYVYGYAEIRARIPYSPGVWASWWTQAEGSLGGRRNFDYMLEVDIYEIFKTYEKTSYLIQWFPAEFDYNKRYEPTKTPGVSTSFTTESWTDFDHVYRFEPSDSLNYEYHIYGFEWTPEEMIMTVDGTVNAKFDLSKPISKHADVSGFHDPQFFIFNTHLFYPGISNSDASIENSPESLPACHYIDYIRLYQKDGVGKLYLAK